MLHRLLIAVAFLVIGTVINISVAWLSSSSHPKRLSEIVFQVYTSNTAPAWLINCRRSFGFRSVQAQSIGYQHMLNIMMMGAKMTPASPSELALVPRCAEPPPVAYGNAHLYRVDSAGWPFLALSYEREGTFDFQRRMYFQSEVRHGVSLEPADANSTSVWRDRALPLRPLFVGFVLNTLLYALLSFLLIAALWSARRWMRYESGRCPACGYRLHEPGPCSECGWRPRSARVA